MSNPSKEAGLKELKLPNEKVVPPFFEDDFLAKMFKW
jgi:hypothetical protein